jgi:hypothetical protein
MRCLITSSALISRQTMQFPSSTIPLQYRASNLKQREIVHTVHKHHRSVTRGTCFCKGIFTIPSYALSANCFCRPPPMSCITIRLNLAAPPSCIRDRHRNVYFVVACPLLTAHHSPARPPAPTLLGMPWQKSQRSALLPVYYRSSTLASGLLNVSTITAGKATVFQIHSSMSVHDYRYLSWRSETPIRKLGT